MDHNRMTPLFPLEGKPAPDTGKSPVQDKATENLSACLFPQTPWPIVQKEIESLLSVREFQRWITPLKAHQDRLGELTLVAPSALVYDTVAHEYLDKITSCTRKLGLDNLHIKLKGPEPITPSDDATTSFSHEDPAPPLDPEAPHQPPQEESASLLSEEGGTFLSTLEKSSSLNPLYTFESFVRGPSNQFALATCLNVADNPGANYNPLFIYGATGLGKTHLLHAVGNKLLNKNPSAVVAYISSERFMNEMIYCIRHNKMWDFRQKYRNCDLFMMDDIQFISGNKSATQEEFFHTFNTLYEAKKQIIVTSDLFPQDIPDIEERLRNRFQWGLIADIQPPDIEHRIAILANKAEALRVNLSKEVAEFIANQARRNVRELEGALHRIAAFAALHGRRLDLVLAREIFHNFTQEAPPKKTDLELIQQVVAAHFQIRVLDLKSRSRLRALSLPRQIAMYLARQHTQASFPEIGERFGGKDHSTVIHAVKKITLDRPKNLEVRMHLEALERQLERENLGKLG